MRHYWIPFSSMLLAGCATHQSAVSTASLPQATPKPLVREAVVTRLVETRYDVRSYRDPDNPGVRHDAHAVYRTTRVPSHIDALESTPRNEFKPASYAPLPASAELAVEIAAQKEIGADLRAIQSRMAAVEQQARSQLATLAGQTAETVNLRRQLEDERARVKELEDKLRDRAPGLAATPASAETPVADPKW